MNALQFQCTMTGRDKHARKNTHLGERLSAAAQRIVRVRCRVRRGDADAGAVYIKVAALDGTCQVYAPLSAEFAEATPGECLILEEGRPWRPMYSPSAAEADADAYLAGQAGVDPDIWILEVEAPEGRHFLWQTDTAVSGD